MLCYVFYYFEGVLGDWMCKFIIGGNFIWVGGVVLLFMFIVIVFEWYFVIIYLYIVFGKIIVRKLKILVMVSWVFVVLKDGIFFFILKYD